MPPRWVQNPVTVFLVPLITLLCAPHLYKLLPASINPTYDDAKLQRIANLMDKIYITLADSTFIPHNSVQRAPHLLNTTTPAREPCGSRCTSLFGTTLELKCKPSASVLRLMELLPYVDHTLILEPDWLYGGHFMDYRNPAHLAELCDPLRGESIGWNDYMSSSDIALTNWGTGGWNNDRTWVLIYNTERDSIRIFDAELWIERSQAKDEFGEEMNDWWFEADGDLTWDRTDGASHILRAIVNNYKKLKRTPWETSNHDDIQAAADGALATRVDPHGLDNDYLRSAMEAYGWPHVFDPVEFNAEFLRAQHMPRNRTMIGAVQSHIDSFERKKAHIGDEIARSRTKLKDARTEDKRWLERWRLQQLEWDLEDTIADLSEVELEKAEMCPNDLCKPNPAPDLWQQWVLSHKLKEAERTTLTETCKRWLVAFEALDAKEYRNSTYQTPSRMEACKVNEHAKLSYIRRAYEHSTADALKLCEEMGCKLLTEEDVWARARVRVNHRHERDNTTDLARITQSLVFKSHIPSDTDVLGKVNHFITVLEYGMGRRSERVDHVEGWINKAKQGGSELYNFLMDMYQITEPEYHYDDAWTKVSWNEYDKWTWLHKVQKQAEGGQSLQTLEREPETIDAAAQTEIDRVRAQHKSSAKRLLKATTLHIHNLQGYNHTIAVDESTVHDSYEGQIRRKEQTLRQHHDALKTAANEDEKALHSYRIQRTTWDISDLQTQLSSALSDLNALCRDSKSTHQDALILWEHLALQHTLEAAQYSNIPLSCERSFRDERGVPNRQDNINACIADKVAQRYYVYSATAQCRDEAVRFCEESGCAPLPFSNVFDRAERKVRDLQRQIAANNIRMAQIARLAGGEGGEMLIYVNEGSVAALEFNRDDALLAQGNVYLSDEVEELVRCVEELRRGELSEEGKGWLFLYLRGWEEEEEEESDD